MHVEDSKRKVLDFLKEFKEIVNESGSLDIKPSSKNLNALADLGLTIKLRKREILSLSLDDYCEGPEPDRDKPGSVWKFG